ncbi:MAG: hypothetical protein Tsb002_29070 [Wenzhouxiangellaceae bacterium]
MTTNRLLTLLLLLLSSLNLSGCAALPPGYEMPVVNVLGLRPVSSSGVVPAFEIDLHIINPNRQALELEGIFYTVEIEGHRILSGVANQLPIVPAYGESDVTLGASVDVLSSITLLTDLMQQPRQQYEYYLDAKLDMGGFRRSLRVDKQGLISLPGRRY